MAHRDLLSTKAMPQGICEDRKENWMLYPEASGVNSRGYKTDVTHFLRPVLPFDHTYALRTLEISDVQHAVRNERAR